MDHAEALNRILSHMAPSGPPSQDDDATYDLHFDNLVATLHVTHAGFRHNADHEYDFTEFRINSLKIGH